MAAGCGLAFDRSFGGVGGRRGGLGLLLLLGEPGRVPAGGGQGVSIRGGRGAGRGGPSSALGVPVRREVLIELVDVKRLNVGHHLVADLADVHGAEVDVGFSAG